MCLLAVDKARGALAGALIAAQTMNPRLREEPHQLFVIATGVVLGFMLVGAIVAYKAFPELWNPELRRRMGKKHS